MWGQVYFLFANLATLRIIPTRVGTRTLKNILKHCAWDHPHACGDKLHPSTSSLSHMGSSPRVWGQELPSDESGGCTGIIPTRVGTSPIGRFLRGGKGDHPHACGDKLRIKSRVRQVVGSSPRVWGQVKLRGAFAKNTRIIPTRVGTR